MRKKIWVTIPGRTPEQAQEAINEIRTIDPDEFYLLSNTEVELKGNWNDFIELLQPYLEEKNKIAYIITPHLDDVWYTPNIKAVRSYAMIESVVPLYRDYTYDDLEFKKLFSCYMFRPDESRGRLIDTIIEHKLRKHGFITYHNTHIKTHKKFKYFRRAPLTIPGEQYSKNNADHFITPAEYRNSFIDVVPEASFLPGMYFLTEKNIRPIMHQKPFITLAPTNYHIQYLKNFFGFELYDEIFDYSFDSDKKLQYRVDGVIRNIEKFTQYNKSDLTEIYNLLKPKLKFNKERIEYIYNNPKMIIPKCMHHLLDPGLKYDIYGYTAVSFFDLLKKYRNNSG